MKGKALPDLTALFTALVVTIGVTFVFYRNLLFVICALPFGVMVYKSKSEEKKKRERDLEKRRCRDAFMSMSSALAAGYALEQAVIQADRELEGLWGDSAFLTRWREMESEIIMHRTIEEAFQKFAEDTGLREVRELAALMAVAKKGGGHIRDLLKTFSGQLEEELYVEAEIQTKLTEKRMELNIMTVMPSFILLYLQFGSMDMISGLYTELWGRVFMTVCLEIYAVGYYWGRRILMIEV